MHCKFRSILPIILIAVSPLVFSSGGLNNVFNNQQQQQGEALKKIKDYLSNLGKYFGYDVSEYCSKDGSCDANANPGGASFSQILVDTGTTNAAQFGLYSSYLGTLLGGNTSQTANPLVPGEDSVINTWSGKAFPSYASQSEQGASVSSTIDQQTYQGDPVSQSILDMLSTPDASYCIYSQNASGNSSCDLLFREKVLLGVVGAIPNTKDAFSPAYNQTLISQLNSNVLLMPLLYSSQNSSSSGQKKQGSDSTPAASASGLTGNSQAQQAANFIRYASGLVNPISLPSMSTYSSLSNIANNDDGKRSVVEQLAAQSTLSDYFTRLRTYTAQTSVGIGNLYYILSKRLPQATQTNPTKNPDGSTNSSSPASGATGSQKDSSEALNDYIMASWRLFDSNTTDKSNSSGQWLNKINKGSSATVQKEIAVLLAEINYQLYLTRQQNERMILTQSIMLLQGARSALPSNALLQSTGNESSTTSN